MTLETDQGTILDFDFTTTSSSEDSVVQTDVILKRGASMNGTAIEFDGCNDYAVVEEDSTYGVDNGTISMSFNANDTCGFSGLMSRDSWGYDGGGHLTIYISNGTLKVRIQSDDKSYFLNGGHVQEGQDYDIAFSFGENGMQLVVNGQVKDTDPYTGGLSGNDEPIVLGASQHRSSDGVANRINGNFDGDISDFKFVSSDVESISQYQTVLVASENFTNGAQGWSNNVTNQLDNGDTYLGNFNGHTNVSKTFEIPDGAETVEINFTFLELDSWNDESFSVHINGVEVNLGDFHFCDDEGGREGVSNGVTWSSVSLDGPSDIGGTHYHTWWNVDQAHAVTLEVPASLLNGDDLTLTFDSDTNSSVYNESYGIDDLVIEAMIPNGHQPPPPPVDEKILIDFNDLPAGTFVSDQYEGVSISAQRHCDWDPANDAMIFDTNNPTGGDWDLGVGTGGALIISEDGDSHDPDDNWQGGKITFDFDCPSTVESMRFIDIDDHCQDTKAKFYDADGNLIEVVWIAPTGNGCERMVDFDIEGVSSMVVHFPGSGALDDLCFVPENKVEDGVVTGTYFIDADGNGLNDDGAALGGVGVDLLDVSGGVVANAITAADGTYTFANVAAGDYTVRFDADPEGRVFTTQDAGSDDTIDSDVDALGVVAVTVTDGGTITVDAGVTDPATSTVSGRYFIDSDGDAQDNGEDGVSSVVVSAVSVATGLVVASDTTAADGSYSITGLAAGDYTLVFTGVDDYLFVAADQGSDLTDSDVVTTLAGGDGETASVTVGINDTIINVGAGIELEDPSDASISGTYFIDTDGDARDNGEAGQPGVDVTVLDASGTVAGTATTGNDGSYIVGGLMAGDYTVVFGAVADFAFVAADQGDDLDDSDVITVLGTGEGQTDTVTLAISEAVTNVDAGIEEIDPETGVISGKAFFDENGDNRSDGETGTVDVTVSLINADTGAVITTASTGTAGTYSFTGLAAGNYQIGFAAAAGLVFSAADVGADLGDSDVISLDGASNGLTDTITLGFAGTATDVDAGYIQPNIGPIAANDAGMGCANDSIGVDVLANDSDPDGVTLTVTEVNGLAIAEAGSVDIGGVTVSLSGGQLIFDGETALAGLDYGQVQDVVYTYTVADADGATAQADVTVTYKGVAETLTEIEATLPATLNYQLTYGGPEAYTIELASATDARFDGLILDNVYCVSAFEPFQTSPDFTNVPLLTGDVYLADAASVPSDLWSPFAFTSNGMAPADNLDLINYILNQDYGAGVNDAEIQSAIWGLTDGFSFIDPADGDQADVDAILLDAGLNGEGFEASAGQIVGLIIDPGDLDFANTQPLIIGMNFDDLDCLL